VVSIVELYCRADDLCKYSRYWQQRWGSLPVQRCLTRRCHIVEDIAMLQLERSHDGHHRFYKLGAFWVMGPKAALAPEHA
jgi:hypothetical protein